MHEETARSVIVEYVSFGKFVETVVVGESGCLNNIIHVERYSLFKNLILVTGYVLRFVRNLRKRIKKDDIYIWMTY